MTKSPEDFPYYRGTIDATRRTSPASLPGSRRSLFNKADKYIADDGLRDAVNVALLLSQPLLLTGEPGTGKTQLAYSLAWELGFDPPLKFETKSNSKAQDLFYTYDALKRFQDTHNDKSKETLHYITYNALGKAILKTRTRIEIESLVSDDFVHEGPSRSVVLIDEIDKAPRDFPNDILNELEGMYFRMPELGNARIHADPNLLPVVIMTSNSEKDLPDPFLRRCIFYSIPFPTPDEMKKIIENRLGTFSSSSGPFLSSALEFFYKLRQPASGIRKKPSTAELLGWITSIREIDKENENPLLENTDVSSQTLSNLIKTSEDQMKAKKILDSWVREQSAK